jgi:PAS domain-containing protein
MNRDSNSHYMIVAGMILLYLLPILVLSGYSATMLPLAKSWRLLMFALVLSIFGSLIMYWLLQRWEERLLPSPVPQETAPLFEKPKEVIQQEAVIDVSKSLLEEELENLKLHFQDQFEELGHKEQQIQELTKELDSLSQEYNQTLHELNYYKKTTLEQLEHKESLLTSHNQTIIEQQASLEKKQQQIVQLETKIRDLNYEIKTLLRLAEIENQAMSAERFVHEPMTKYQPLPESTSQEISPSLDTLVHTSQEASSQLRRCLDIAQKLTSAVHYGMGTSRLRDLPVDNYALDFRRLSDSLRSENNCAVMLFSQKDSRLLFVNDVIRNLLGWTPEKFTQTFSDIIQPSADVWREGLVQLYSKNEVSLQLILRGKSGEDIHVNALLGNIPTGVFRNHSICILYN